MKKQPKHAVVILNYNGADDTLACLASIAQAKDAPHVIVVDNQSSDDSVQRLLARYPSLDLIRSPQNLGFAGGNNLGIRRALRLGAKVVYLLNNDTLVDPNLFFRAFRATHDKPVIVGGKIYYAKNYEFHAGAKGRGDVIWYAGGAFDWQSVTVRHLGVDEIDQGQYDRPAPTEIVTGCFMALPRRTLSKLGLLDDSLFLYLEDAEYCLRAARLGIARLYNPTLKLYHKNSATSGVGSPLVDYYLTRNRFALAKKYGTFRLRLALIKEALTRNWASPLRRAAFFDYLWGRMGNRNEIARP